MCSSNGLRAGHRRQSLTPCCSSCAPAQTAAAALERWCARAAMLTVACTLASEAASSWQPTAAVWSDPDVGLLLATACLVATGAAVAARRRQRALAGLALSSVRQSSSAPGGPATAPSVYSNLGALAEQVSPGTCVPLGWVGDAVGGAVVISFCLLLLTVYMLDHVCSTLCLEARGCSSAQQVAVLAHPSLICAQHCPVCLHAQAQEASLPRATRQQSDSNPARPAGKSLQECLAMRRRDFVAPPKQ